jgi:ribosomal protein S18 acetylase RimI-like enzyme
MTNAHSDSVTGKDFRIKDAELVDLSGMVKCHITAFPGRFMTEMGPRWLYGLYRFFIRHPAGISFVGVDSTDKTVGFAVGGKPHIREQFLRIAIFRYSYLIFWKFFTKSMVRNAILKELAKKLHLKCMSSSLEDSQQENSTARCSNLLSICVFPEYKGTGIAGRLIESFQAACAAKGYDTIELSVVTDNARAIAFYKKHDWREVGKSGESTKFVLDL